MLKSEFCRTKIVNPKIILKKLITKRVTDSGSEILNITHNQGGLEPISLCFLSNKASKKDSN